MNSALHLDNSMKREKALRPFGLGFGDVGQAVYTGNAKINRA